ncbi:MAG: response regulator [Caldilineae bacterium]|nr:MAG: response regulator [Caldilineae bacterium]
MWDTLTAGRVWEGRFVNKKKDGTFFTVEATISTLVNEHGRIVNYVGVQRDISRELALEEQFRQSQKMEAIGRLTGGIAHDFNNILTAINGFAELMVTRMPPDDPFRKMAESILQSGQSAASLVQQLLVFSRKQKSHPKPLNLNAELESTRNMLRRIIGEDITLEMNTAPDLWAVLLDPAQFQQVVVNLAVNARDAMPDGGRLTIETANVTLDSTYVANRLGFQPGDYVLLSISDTGIGMPPEVKEHIFEPFFTTKEKGAGTGLGLSTVYGIVHQHNGHIWVYSEVNEGTTFKIYFPRTEAETFEETAEVDVSLPAGGGESILLVEDDPQVRAVTREILTDAGYRVLEAENGPSALDVAGRHSGDIHLLLTDVVMPDMSGTLLAQELRKRRPALKVLFMSGYTEKGMATHHRLKLEGTAFISKPFSPVELVRKVRAALEG